MIQVTDQSHRLSWAWCPRCDAETTMVSPQQAAVIAGVTVRVINRSVESELVHFLETGDGLLLLCLNSLGESVKHTLKGE